MKNYDYDLFVIGGGSGGVRAARISATHGAKVGIAEEYRFGGTCVIRGCVPKKLLVYASRFREEFKDAEGFGWTVGDCKFDWKSLIFNKDREIERLEDIYRNNLINSGVEVFNCRAEFVDQNTIELSGEKKRITAKHILIATGGTPFVDREKPGSEHVITSNEAFHLAELPNSIIIVGGGYIAVEFAGIFNGLGVNTTLVYRGEEILRGFDDDIRKILHGELVQKGVTIVTGELFENIEKNQNGIVGTTTTGRKFESEQIMLAIGRLPNTAGLGLEKAGVDTKKNGAIVVDPYSKTNKDNIYAVGDVTDRVNLTPVAIREGHAFADTLFGNKPTTVDHTNYPSAVFSQPEFGTVGLSEQEARKTFNSLDIYKSHFLPLKGTLSNNKEKAFIKLIVDADSGRVLGAHVIGNDAGEMAQLLAIPLKMGAAKEDFDATIAVHPTLAEEIVTMRQPTEEIRQNLAK